MSYCTDKLTLFVYYDSSEKLKCTTKVGKISLCMKFNKVVSLLSELLVYSVIYSAALRSSSRPDVIITVNSCTCLLKIN